MIVNLVLILIILILGVITPQSHRKHYIIGVSILLILHSGLRNWAVGADTYAYYHFFEYVKSFTWSDIQNFIIKSYSLGTERDPGYAVFQKLVQYVLPQYQLFLMLIAIFFFTALGNFIYKNTTRISDAMLSYVLYLCVFFGFFSITGLRQTIATAAVLYGYELIKKKKLVLFLLLILLASTIHRSVLIFIPFYFIAGIRKTKFFLGGVLLLFPFLMIYSTTIFNYFSEVGGYNKDYGFYAGGGTYIFTLLMLLIAVVGLWRMKIAILQNEAVLPFYNAFILALFFTPLTWINPSAMRIVQYFSIFLLVLIPSIINSFEVKSHKLRTLVSLITIITMVTLFIAANTNYEYKFCWQRMQLPENYKIYGKWKD